MAAEVARAEASVPALVHSAVVEGLTSEDVALPRLYIGQYMSDAVKEGLVKAGAIFTAAGSDDPDPSVLAQPERGGGVKQENGVLFHVLALKKGKSFSDGGELTLYDYDDPNAPDEAWVTYGYTIALPEVDDEVPYKWLLTRTGRPAAKQINTVLVKNATKPAHTLAFKVSTQKKENAKGEYFVARVAPVEATKKNVEIAEKLSAMISSQPATHTTNEEPNI